MVWDVHDGHRCYGDDRWFERCMISAGVMGMADGLGGA